MNQPARVQPPTGQATQIEQSRVEAEVKAAVLVAQQCPRNVEAAVASMQFACAQPALAEKAFFSYPRAGETVSGPSIHLACELALNWGNIQHGVTELSRDVAAGQSEILAFAWDLQTNSRNAQIFIAPHIRDTKRGQKKLTDLRDVYENNANMGARRLRECIFKVLPTWYVEQAIQICTETIRKGDGKPLEERIRDTIDRYQNVGISIQQLEKKVGQPRGQWAETNVAQLDVIYRSVERGEITRDEAFPAAPVTAQEITGGALADGEPAASEWPEVASSGSGRR